MSEEHIELRKDRAATVIAGELVASGIDREAAEAKVRQLVALAREVERAQHAPEEPQPDSPKPAMPDAPAGDALAKAKAALAEWGVPDSAQEDALLKAVIRAARAEENEACAKLCDTLVPKRYHGRCYQECAAAIRARSTPSGTIKEKFNDIANGRDDD